MNRLTLIGLAGAAGTGKDTAADHLEAAHGFARWAFAEPMRTMLEALLVECGQDHAYLFEPALKELPVPGLGVSYRHMAQTLGTEWGRQLLGEDFWLRAAGLCTGLSSTDPGQNAPVHDRIVFSDVRFPNEAAWLRARGGVVVRIERPGAPGVRTHVSEQLLDQLQPEHVILNAGRLVDLHDQLDALLLQLTEEQPA